METMTRPKATVAGEKPGFGERIQSLRTTHDLRKLFVRLAYAE